MGPIRLAWPECTGLGNACCWLTLLYALCISYTYITYVCSLYSSYNIQGAGVVDMRIRLFLVDWDLTVF